MRRRNCWKHQFGSAAVVALVSDSDQQLLQNKSFAWRRCSKLLELSLRKLTPGKLIAYFCEVRTLTRERSSTSWRHSQRLAVTNSASLSHRAPKRDQTMVDPAAACTPPGNLHCRRLLKSLITTWIVAADSFGRRFGVFCRTTSPWLAAIMTFRWRCTLLTRSSSLA